MATLFVNGVVLEDAWVSVDGEQPIPEGENIIVSLAYFLENRDALLARNAGRLGVHLEAGDTVDMIAPDLDRLTLVSLDFPSFADGRSFSKARLLRDKYGFEGEVRGVGDIRIDQVTFMKRSGFDALLITHQKTIDCLIQNKNPGLDLYYQPALADAEVHGAKRWARRAI